tara:strand:- start:777 stop:920 length:144 start_codon:yes stop_codon:yes gene_type:complete
MQGKKKYQIEKSSSIAPLQLARLRAPQGNRVLASQDFRLVFQAHQFA